MKVFKSVSICDSLKLQCTSCHRYRRMFEIRFSGIFWKCICNKQVCYCRDSARLPP